MLPLFISDLGASVTQVGLVFTLSSLVPLVLQIFGGWLSDNFGRLRAVAIGSVGGVVGHFIIAYAGTWQWVLVGLSVGAIARSMVGPSFSAFIAEQSNEENRGKVYGVTDTIFMIINVVGPPLGGLLVNRFDFKLMLLVSAGMYTSAALLRIWMARTAGKQERETSEPLSFDSLKISLKTMFGMLIAGGLITWVFLTDGIRDTAFRMSEELFPLYLEDFGGLSAMSIGWLGSIFGVAMMIVTIPAGWLSDKFGERVPILAGFFLDAVSMFLFPRVEGFYGFAAIWALFGVAVGLQSPAYNSLVSKAVPEKMRGVAFGLFWTSLGVISLPAPYIGASLWERYGPRVPFTITAVLAALALIPVFFKFRLPDKEGAVSEDGVPLAEEAAA